ncbi:unnamed protein product [Leptidea sinapis]|uniref:Uncharacterized protein n=1 Tax=Leptidea sinapis TaxID=189913 RepID=A0A5E4QQU5_9NEOP|nr:unnamed protein product [Leptidea sinapis]
MLSIQGTTILATISAIQKEVCLKFFMTPLNNSLNHNNKVLHITNPDKRKTCPPGKYDFKRNVIEMPIGYKCINQKDITRIIVDMLRASIEQTVSQINRPR